VRELSLSERVSFGLLLVAVVSSAVPVVRAGSPMIADDPEIPGIMSQFIYEFYAV
jgi:hypothetical protein